MVKFIKHKRCDEVCKSICDLVAHHAGPCIKYAKAPEPTSPSVTGESLMEEYRAWVLDQVRMEVVLFKDWIAARINQGVYGS